jgi:hypothetical protein
MPAIVQASSIPGSPCAGAGRRCRLLPGPRACWDGAVQAVCRQLLALQAPHSHCLGWVVGCSASGHTSASNFTITVATAHTCIVHECGVARAPVVLRLPAPKQPQPLDTGPAPESGRSSDGPRGPCPPDGIRSKSAGSLQSGICCCRAGLPNPLDPPPPKLPAKAELSWLGSCSSPACSGPLRPPWGGLTRLVSRSDAAVPRPCRLLMLACGHQQS